MQIHSQDDFWKRGTKMTTLEEQPRLMEDIGAPPPGFFFGSKEWEHLIGTKFMPLSIYEDLKNRC